MSIVWKVEKGHAARESWFSVGSVFNLEGLTVKEWQRGRGTTKKQTKRSW